MPDAHYLLACVVLAAAITFALRSLPFTIIEPLRSSRLAGELSRRMPAGLMLILVLYLLRDVPEATASSAVTSVSAVALVAGLQLWRSNALLSIFVGTTFYVLTVNVLLG